MKPIDHEADTAPAGRTPAISPLAISAADAALALGLSRASIFRALASGRLPKVKVGNRTLIPVAALRALIAPKAAA